MAHHVACLESELPVGSMKSVVLDETDVLLVHFEDGIYAVSGICTHAQVHLGDGWLEGDLVCCPKHGGKFHVRTGKSAAFPAVSALEKFEVAVVNGQVTVEIED
jgi:3-phenylpropionate/trans-cinnamate dioxygenase ferredoxin subunit